MFACLAEPHTREIADALLRHGADPNDTKPLSGITALMVAAANDNLPCVQALLDSYADVGAFDSEGLTTYDHADGDCRMLLAY
mmetsp:Transcript_22799/g.69772  ORF Transcript_22799/g.69772 Transcript_22799/m.69772 type:complete len:83 (+) Transcript_22799:383-631(+)